jgi:hypothetical protein
MGYQHKNGVVVLYLMINRDIFYEMYFLYNATFMRSHITQNLESPLHEFGTDPKLQRIYLD